ncbi:MAG: ROK family protein [Anaerolineaceae bacterium]|nr:ROK family protein [Anaerolineaceae bacterium]
MNEKQSFQENKTWIGVDIGGTKTAIVLSSDPPKILARIEFPTLPDQGPERALGLIKQNIHQIISASNIDQSKLGGIGISCGGPLDRKTGMIQAPPNLTSWVNVPITSILHSEFAIDCKLENDANAGAVAEHRYGAGQGTHDMVFLTMGTGIGAGIIADGRLYRGASDQAGEIGHVRLSPSGPIGYEKAGSVEGWASGGGMAKVACLEVAAATKNGEVTVLSEKFHNNGILTAKDVADAAQQGDEVAKRIIHNTGNRLGEALAILVDLLNPERIVIGGLAMRLGESILAPARTTMQQEALVLSAKNCQVVPAVLGEQIGDIAAICVAMGL